MKLNKNTLVTRRNEPFINSFFGGSPFFRSVFDDFFDEDFSSPQVRENQANAQRWLKPQFGIQDLNDHYLVTMDVLGVREKDIEIEVKDGHLNVHAKRESQSNGTQSFVEYRQSFLLPEGIDEESLEAHYENGVLNLAVPKKEKKEPLGRKIEVKTKKEGIFQKLLGTKTESTEKH